MVHINNERIDPYTLSFDEAYEKALELVKAEKKKENKKYEEGRIPEKCNYIYGVQRTKKGKFIRFICKDENNIPQNAVIVKRGNICSSKILEETNKIVEEYISSISIENKIESVAQSKAEPESNKSVITDGDIINYIDGGNKIHLGIVIYSYDKYEYRILFVTSNPNWNPNSRRITKEECTFIGYPYKNKGVISYLAPVIRESCFIYPTGRSISKHRLEDLKKEFLINKFKY